MFWGDILNQNFSTDLPLWKKVIFGLELVFFWIFSPIWKGALKNKLIFVSIIFSGILLTGWYLSIIALLIVAINNSDYIAFTIPSIPESYTVILATILGIFPTALILKVSGFSMKFLKSNVVRESIKSRIVKQMNIVLDKDYDRITLFSHSFGAIPTLGYLSDFQNNKEVKIRCITIGAAISFFANRSSIIKDWIGKCTANENIDEWKDYFSREDYLCSYDTIDEFRESFDSEELQMDSSWLTRLSRKVHSQYFDDSRVMEKLISN